MQTHRPYGMLAEKKRPSNNYNYKKASLIVSGRNSAIILSFSSSLFFGMPSDLDFLSFEAIASTSSSDHSPTVLLL
jgi:hypothetical protein